MSVTVSYGCLVSFLQSQQAVDRSTPTTKPTGLCLLAGGIVGRNLEAELARQEIPAAGIEISTIEDTARELLESANRRQTDTPPVEILDQQFCEQLVVDTIADAPDAESLNAVEDLLSGFDWAGRPTLRETLWKELDRYFRMTDAGRDHESAVDVATTLAESDPYAGGRSRQALRAFDELQTALEGRIEPLAETWYLSRSHLVRAARKQLAAEWSNCFPDVEWVAVDTVSVLDNPTLRLFEELAELEAGPDLYLFGHETGAGPALYDRLAAAGLDPTLATSESPSQPHVSALTETVDGEPPAAMPDVEFIEAPDGRRELEWVAMRIRELTGMDDRGDTDDEPAATSCGEIIIAAKDVIPYRSRIEDVFTSHSIPTHIEARQPLMQTVPYRYLRALFDLVAAAASDTPVTLTELVDPLRLGFRPPETDRAERASSRRWESESGWPLDSETVCDIEARLSAVGPTGESAQPVDDWVESVRAAYSPGETPALHTFLEWIEATAEQPPDSGAAVVDLLEAVLDEQRPPLLNSGVRAATGPGIDGTRPALSAKHDSHVVARFRESADSVGRYVEQAADTGLATLGWEAAAEAVRAVYGGGSYWPRNADGNAVRIVNAANAAFASADHVFVIGLAAEEFPAKRSPPTFFHEAFYRAVAAASESTGGYLHAPTSRSQFESDIEEYRAAIGAATEDVSLLRQYRTTDGEAVPWSGFVDAYTSRADAEIRRLAVDQWFPATDGEDPTAMATPRDRLRLFCATFPDGIGSTARRQSAGSLTENAAITDLLSRIDSTTVRDDLEPRRQRYLGADIRSITVDPSETVFDTGARTDSSRSLASLTGPPIRAHELDLYANCPLKFYFYQYLDGGGSQRDRVSPPDGARLPTPVGDRYPEPAVVRGLRRLISSPDRLADRQTTFGQYDSLGAFRDQLADWIDTDPALDRRLMQPLLGEYRAVQQELDAGVSRQWRWETASTVSIDGTTVEVPGHRVDYIPDYDISIPVWYTAGDGVAASVVSQSLTPTAGTARDHRLLLGSETVDNFGGTVVCDPTSAAATARQGFFVDDLNPIPDRVPQDSNLVRTGRSDWRDTRTQWLAATADQLAVMTAVEDPISYRVSDSFVEDDGCAGCDYRKLCQVPAAKGRGGQ